jgi:hypothetical protein
MADKQKKIDKASSKGKDASSKKVESTDASSTLSKVDDALKGNTVLFGAEDAELELAGKSVADIRKDLKHALNIPDDAQARVDGELKEKDKRGSYPISPYHS